jgi:predicted ATPase
MSNEISRIREQFQSGLWPQFVEYIELENIRGWSNQGVNFKFPLTAIVGENGSGKSTLLKALACCYENPAGPKKTFYPTQFFIDTQWEKLSKCKITFRIKQGDNTSTFNIRKPSERWKYPSNRHKRNTYILDVSRTLPLDATAGYAKLAKQSQEEVANIQLTEDNRRDLSYILGKSYDSARFATTDYDRKKQIGLLKRDFGEISQFHQGAGEDATLDLFQLIESISDYSLFIIDEVEASLHPRSQRRLIKILLKLCRLKRIQIVISTHSPYVLEELPPEARQLLLPKDSKTFSVLSNVSTEFAMSKIDDSDHPELYLYVEDAEAETLVYEIIKGFDKDDNLLPRVKCLIVGPANVVKTMGDLSANNKLPNKGIGILDGDIEISNGCIKLPGETAPEILVYNSLKAERWPQLENRFGIGAGSLFTILDEVILEPDHHKWNIIVGDRTRMSAKDVWRILVKEWVAACLDEKDGIEFYSNVNGKL